MNGLKDAKDVIPDLEEAISKGVSVEVHDAKGLVIDNIGEDDFAVSEVEAGDREAGTKRYRVIINESDGMDAKKKDVFVACNGFACLIRRGVPVNIREGILNVLRESVITQLAYDDDGKEVYTDIPRFSLQILGEVNDSQ